MNNIIFDIAIPKKYNNIIIDGVNGKTFLAKLTLEKKHNICGCFSYNIENIGKNFGSITYK